MGLIFIVCAPSGAGKTSLVSALLKQEGLRLGVTISHTTRKPRPLEVQGRDYYFVSPSEFEALKQAQGFLESATVFGHSYGTSRAELDRLLVLGDVILDIDWQGALQVKALYPENTVSVFILPPTLSVLKQRLERRGQDEAEVIQYRMAEARAEISHYQEFDYLLVNDRFEEALEGLAGIIRAENLKRARSEKCHQNLLLDLLQES